MITLQKAQVYSKYNGDLDYWLRDATADDKSIMDSGDWSEIESIVDELNIMKKKNKYTNIDSTERTYRVMTDEEVENVHKQTMRFTMVAPDEYEVVMGELWKFA